MASGDKPKKEKSTSPFRDNIEVIVFAITMSLGLKVFALEAYQIPTGSMQPTLMGTELYENGAQVGGVHDRVLVDKICYLIRDPKRWEVVVFRYPLAATNNYVKRLIGMPGEDLFIQNGDIWTRAIGTRDPFVIQRKPHNIQRDLWKQVYPMSGNANAAWTNWDLRRLESANGDGVLTVANDGVLSYPGTNNIRDLYRHGYPEAIYQKIQIGGAGAQSNNVLSDLRFIFDVTPSSGTAPLIFEAECGAFFFEIKLGLDGCSMIMPDKTEQAIDFTPRADKKLKVDFAFWDHQWRLELDGEVYTGLIDSESRPAGRNGMALRSSGSWQVANPKIYRDIHYLPSLEGAAGFYTIPEDEYFMMGDNTQNSLDSRDWAARILEFETPVQGMTGLRGDNLPDGHDPAYNNPRWDRAGQNMTIRDEWGDLHTFTREELAQHKEGVAELTTVHTVPRRYIQGKAIAIFLPIPPFAPVWRFGWVH